MSVENGHVTAPVGLDEVRSLLGEASIDVKTVCMSENINPYSLIRPFPPESPRPNFEVRQMMEGTIAHGPIQPVPPVYSWYRGRWGYYVPYVGNAANIKDISEVAWVRPGIQAEDFGNLAHFDGYRHDIEPDVMIKIDALTTGARLRVSIYPGTAQTDIISSTGENNKGGVVSVAEVLGRVKLGFSLWKNNSLVGHYQSNTWLSSSSDSDDGRFNEITLIEGPVVESGASYTMIPWATNLGYDSNGNLLSGSMFFCLKYAEDYESTKNEQADRATVRFEVESWSREGSKMTFNIKGTNTYGVGTYYLRDFKLRISYRIGSNLYNGREITLYPIGIRMDIPASSSVKLDDLSTTEVPSEAIIQGSFELKAWSSEIGDYISTPSIYIDSKPGDVIIP